MILLKTVSFQQLKVNENSIFSSHSIDLWIFMIDCSKLFTWLEFSWNDQPGETFLMMTHICLIQVECRNIQFLLINFVPLTSSSSEITFSSGSGNAKSTTIPSPWPCDSPLRPGDYVQLSKNSCEFTLVNWWGT